MAVQTDCCSCAVTCYSENLVVPWGSRPHPPCSLALWHQNLRCFHKHFEEVIDTSSTAGVILTPDPHSAARFLLRVWFFFFFFLIFFLLSFFPLAYFFFFSWYRNIFPDFECILHSCLPFSHPSTNRLNPA